MKKRRGLQMLVLTGVLSLIFCAAVFAPPLYAQSNPNWKSETEQYLMMLEYAFRYVQDHYVEEVSPETLYEGAMRGLFESLDDPYSVFLDSAEMDDYSDTTTGEFGGVGLYISKQTNAQVVPPADPDNETEAEKFRRLHAPYVEVISPIEGTPAYRAGISTGDFITAINDESTGELTMDEVLLRLRGRPGAPVTMKIARRGNLTFTVTINREIIEVPTIRYAMMPGNIAYIKLIRWTPHTHERVEEALAELNKTGFSSLILDVRGNPGGLLTSVVDTADLFLESGVIVSTRSRIDSENKTFSAKKDMAVPMSLPIVVLIDKGSASASEILAGALKDTGRAVLVGDTTFGKGSVQQIRGFGTGGFKITTSRYFTPGDINIDKIGVAPHVFVAPEEFSEEQRVFLQKLFDERQIPRFVESNPVPDNRKIDAFVKELRDQGIALDSRILAKLVREEYNRNSNDPPAFDLDFDTALQEAAHILMAGDTRKILDAQAPGGGTPSPAAP